MNYKYIKTLIENNNLYYSQNDIDVDDFDIDINHGMYLYDSKVIIEKIQKYLCNLLKKQDLEIDENDIFHFLFIKKFFKKDYSKLSVQISKVIEKADYGEYEFFGDEKEFKKLNKKLKELYNEFKNIQ